MKALLKAAGCFFAILVLVLTPVLAHAQGGVAIHLDGVDVTRFPEITVFATVSDENGLPVPGLAAEQFELIEDGQASFPPSSAKAITNDQAVTSVLILLDLGSTMKGKPLEAAREAAGRFLEKLLNQAPDSDQAAFIGFGREVDIKELSLSDSAREVPFTDDRGRLLNVVNFVEADAAAGTPLYDALYRAIKIAAARPGRRAVIVMTDGRDSGSTLKEDDPITEAQRQRIPVFPIGLSNSRLDKQYLTRLAELTGGQYQEAPTPDEFTAKFDEVLTQLKVQYVLTYRSRAPRSDGQYHSLLARVNTAHGQGFDEAKFLLGTPITPSTPAPTGRASAPPPTETPKPQPTATPSEEKGLMDDITTWISDNTMVAVGIAVVAILLIALVVFAVMLLRRRASAQQQPGAEWPAQGEQGYGAAWAPPPGEVAPAGGWGPGSAQPSGQGRGGLSTDRQAPTGRPPATEEAGTWVAPTDAPVAAQPFGLPPAKPAWGAPTPAAGSEDEETAVIRRGPKLKTLGFLVDRRQPDRRFDVDKPNNTIGRASGNTIVIDHPTISRQHAAVKIEGPDFRLYDLGSANGTFLAGQRVREPVALEDGAVVRFGDAEFIFKRMSLE